MQAVKWLNGSNTEMDANATFDDVSKTFQGPQDSVLRPLLCTLFSPLLHGWPWTPNPGVGSPCSSP